MKNPIVTPSNIVKKGQRSFMIPLMFAVTLLKAVVGSETIIVVAGAGPASRTGPDTVRF